MKVGSKREEDKEMTRLKADGAMVARILKANHDRMVELGEMCVAQKEELARLKSNGLGQWNSNQKGGDSNAGLEGVRRDILDLQRSVSNMLKSPSNGVDEAVTIGGFTFNNDQDVLVWMEKFLGPRFNFGAFLDVYGLLARFVTRKGDDMAKAMEARAKVFLTASEEVTLETFRQPLPIIFGKCTDGSALMAGGGQASMLPGLKTEDAWLKSDHSSGIKVSIEDQCDNVMEQMHRLIGEQLGSLDTRAISLATTMLAQSMSFIHELCNYITVTLAELRASGFQSKDNWYLLTKLLFRIFAIDFNKVRSVVIEGLDVDKQDKEGARKQLAKRALWGVIQTHGKMREYLKVGFKNHPSISSEYVRFLIQKASVGRVEKLETQCASLRDRVQGVEETARSALRKGETALNRADEAKKLAKK